MNIAFKKNCRYCLSRGFTLLEVMIAVVIFSFLILYVSQLMNMEIRLFNTVSNRNDLAHNSRASMMHILDEIRLNPNAEKVEYASSPVKRYYYSGDPDGSNTNKGVYYTFLDPVTNNEITRCLINVNPPPDLDPATLPEGPLIYFRNSELRYIDVNGNHKKISDQIQSVNLSTEPDPLHLDRLLKIEITTIDNSKLVSWIRLY